MKNSKWFTTLMVALILFSLGVTSCKQQDTNAATNTDVSTPAPTNATTISLTGAGATFPAPLYTKWFDEYYKLYNVKVNYQAIGSGGGIEQITAKTVNFGASDGIMSLLQQQQAEDGNGPILHVPMTSGAVALAYNLPGIPSGQLKLTGDVLANIFLKKITNWNDPAIAALNPGVNLPKTHIAVVHRSDGSGTTYIFTNYLSKVSSDWNMLVGSGTAVNWPGDIGGPGSAGVAGAIQQTPGAIGYIELAYAQQNNMPVIQMKNAAGNFETPSLDGTTKAMEGVTLPDDMKIMFTNSPNPDAYPICGFSWILVYVNQTDKVTGTALAKMLWWAIHDGQSTQYTEPLGYAPLSPEAVTKAEKEILSINYQGQPLIIR